MTTVSTSLWFMKPTFSRRAVTSKYLAALGLLGVLSLVGYFSLHFLIEEHLTNSSIINVSGRQRTLLQRVALVSMQYANTSNPGERASSGQNLREAVNLMETTHENLTKGNEQL